MGFSYTGPATTSAHQHTALASDGGQLNLNLTRITGLSPMTVAVAFG